MEKKAFILNQSFKDFIPWSLGPDACQPDVMTHSSLWWGSPS
jgi:hypothetical protein